MLTDIGDGVEVTAVFDERGLRPASFVWRGRDYHVQEVTGHWRAARGQNTLLFFAVTDGTDVFELCLDTATMRWELVKADVA